MMDQIILWIETIMGSGWLYPVLTMFVIGDAIFPLIPAETLLTLAGAWSGARGVPLVQWVFFVGLLGAMIGDNLCFFMGHRLIKFTRRLQRRKKIADVMKWINESIERRAGVTIIVARFIPWARWILTIMLGSQRYPWWKFIIFDTIGILIWAGQAVFVGYIGGWVVQDYPLIGVAIGLTLGVLVGAAIDKVRSRIGEYLEVSKATSTA